MASPHGSPARPRIVTGKNAYVDESLFGAPPRPSSGKMAGAAPQVRRQGSKTASPSRSPAAAASLIPSAKRELAISKDQLERMLAKASVLSPEETAARRRELAEAQEEELAKARAAHQQARAQEAAAKAALPPSEMDAVRERERREVMARAQQAFLAERDDVKVMAQMVNYSKIMAKRDQQMAEKQAARLRAAEEERTIAQDMEAKRQAAVKETEERERQRELEQRRGAMVILDQLAEREQQRAAAEKKRREDGEDMTRRIERLKQEEQEAEAARKAAAKALMEEVTVANAHTMQRKVAARVAEQEENARIAAFIRERDAREQKLAEEREQIAKQKELEVARLRAAQEKILDTRSAEDEARAKHYQDQAEMRDRAREAAERAKRDAMQRDLEQSRVEQLARKAAQAEERKAAEQREHRHQQQLLKQMEARKDMKQREREARVEEGHVIKAKLEEERALLAAVKEAKLRELAEAGVPEKYHSALARCQPGAAALLGNGKH
eukprot:scaffold3.g6300.t1